MQLDTHVLCDCEAADEAILGRSPRSLAAAKTRTAARWQWPSAVAASAMFICTFPCPPRLPNPGPVSTVEAGGSGTLSTLYGIMGPVTTAREYERLRRRPRGLWPTMTANTDRFTYELQNEWRRVGYQMPSQNKGFRARCAQMLFNTHMREFLG